MNTFGDDLLRTVDETADYVLVIYDGEIRISVNVHKLVLQTSSPMFKKLIGSDYFQFFYVWVVPAGYIAAAVRLVKYFYSRQLSDLGDIEMSKNLCIQLECIEMFNFLSQISQMVSKATINHVRTLTPAVKTRPLTRSQDQIVTRSRKIKRR